MAKAKAPKATKMVPPDDQPKAASSKKLKHVSKVNMHLPTGQTLHVGQEVELTKESRAHLSKHFHGKEEHLFEDVADVADLHLDPPHADPPSLVPPVDPAVAAQAELEDEVEEEDAE